MGGLKGLTPERIAEHQRLRLETAMVEAVARHGYQGTTLRELVGLAGVSKSTFYEHFQNKHEAFLATSDLIVDQITERIEAAYRSEGDYRQRLVAALSTFMSLVVNQPQAATLTTVETLTLGKAGVEHRERSAGVFEALFRQSFEQSPSPIEVPPMTVRAIAAGIRGVVYRHLRAGSERLLPGLVEELTDWALGYQRPLTKTVQRVAAAAAKSQADLGMESAEELGWSEPPDSPRSRAELSQRERIIRAVARLVVQGGYETLSIPTISATAGTSNQTFYEHFDSKLEAFLAAFDFISAEALSATSAAFESTPNGPAAIGIGLRAMLEYFTAHELFAHLTFFELQTAGPVALDHGDAAMESFTTFLQPDLAPRGIRAVGWSPTLQAIASGTWSVIQNEVARSGPGSLPQLAPDLVAIILMPLTTG